MTAKNKNITKNPVAAGRKGGKRRGKNKATLLREALGLNDPQDLQEFRKALLNLATEFLMDSSKKMKFLAWKEMMKYVFPQKREQDIPAMPDRGGKTTVFIIPGFEEESPAGNE